MVARNWRTAEVLWVLLGFPESLSVASQLLLAWTWSCQMDIPARHIGETHEVYVGTYAVAITNTQSLEQDAEAPCVDKS